MDAYEIDLNVNVHDVDYNGIAKTSSVMRYIQSAAQAQLTAGGMSYDNLKKRSRAFILSRIRLEICEPLRAYAPLKAMKATWSRVQQRFAHSPLPAVAEILDSKQSAMDLTS